MESDEAPPRDEILAQIQAAAGTDNVEELLALIQTRTTPSSAVDDVDDDADDDTDDPPRPARPRQDPIVPPATNSASNTPKGRGCNLPVSQPKKKQLEGQPKRPAIPYHFFQKEIRPRVKEANPTLPAADITKLIGAKWKALSDNERRRYQNQADGDRIRYEREMTEWKEKLGPEKVKEMEEAELQKNAEKKRKRDIERAERNAKKAVAIGSKSKERFEAMRGQVSADASVLFRATEGKPVVSAIVEDSRPYFAQAEYVEVAADTSPNQNRPYGKGYVVDARGTGTGTIVDVVYQKAYDDGATVGVPSAHPLNAIRHELGRVHKSVPFSHVTRVPMVHATPPAKRQRTAAKAFVFQTPPPKKKVDNRSPAEKIVDKMKEGVRLKKPFGWWRDAHGLRQDGKNHFSTREKDALLSEWHLLKQHFASHPQYRGRDGRFKSVRKGSKNPATLGYFLWAWGRKGERYINTVRKQLHDAWAGSAEYEEIMDTMLHFPATDDNGEKVHESVIDSPSLAARFFTPARLYATNTLRQQKEDGSSANRIYNEEEVGSSYSSRLSALMEKYESINADNKVFWEAKSREKIALQPTIRGAIVDAMRRDPKMSWESIEADDAINHWCSADTIRRWVESREGYCLYAERIIPLLSDEQRKRHFDFANLFRSNWGLGAGKYLLIHYDEKWFWGLVQRRHAKACKELELDPVTFKAYHRNHVNKVMGVAVTAFAFEDSIENGGDALKLGFFRAQQYKIADKALNRTETLADGTEVTTNVRNRDDPYLVDCAVTGTDIGTPDDPKFPLKNLFEQYVFPTVSELVGEGAAYEGYTPVFQGDNAGPHEETKYLEFVKGYCLAKGWHWMPQAPQMPHMNVLDLSVFPCMSRRHCSLARRRKGLRVLKENEIWDAAVEIWDGLESAKIASAYVQAHRIAKRVIDAGGSNEFLGVGGSPHVGIRRDFYPTKKGLARRDGQRIPAPGAENPPGMVAI